MTEEEQGHTSFMGIKVEGDITRGRELPDQRPKEELEPLIQALLDDPTIVEFGWRQYTPYFNDGEPCVFNVYGAWVRTTADVLKSDDDDDDYEDNEELNVDYHRSLGKYEYDYTARAYGPYEGPDEERYKRCKALGNAVESGAFDQALLKAFGDHAKVTIKKNPVKISVEFYEHD